MSLARTFGEIACKAAPDRERLADRAFEALSENDYGEYDGSIPTLASALGATGLQHVKARMATLSRTPVHKPAEEHRRVLGRGMNGLLF